MSRRYLSLTFALLLAAPLVARGEVSVELNPNGFVTGVSVSPAPDGAVWTPWTTGNPALVLNPQGDLMLDHAPTCGIIALPMDDPMRLRFPGGTESLAADTADILKGSGRDKSRRVALAVWARWDGSDRELVWSMWDYRTWSWRSAAFVETADNAVEDIDPVLFIRGKRVYLVWRQSGAPDDRPFMLSAAYLIETGGNYELAWDAPIAVGGDIQLDDENVSLPELLDGGLGSSPTSHKLGGD